MAKRIRKNIQNAKRTNEEIKEPELAHLFPLSFFLYPFSFIPPFSPWRLDNMSKPTYSLLNSKVREIMQASKQRKLENAVWKTGSAKDFLNLTPEENAYFEMKYSLGLTLKKLRNKENLSQVEVAKILKSSQSRLAKMEAGDPSVSIDLLIKSLLALGAKPKDLAKAIT